MERENDKMIIDVHVHLPVIDGCTTLQQKKERLLLEMKKNHVAKCIVISDSDLVSPIGNLDECVELFSDIDNVYVVGGISPFSAYETQLEKLKHYIEKKKLVGIKLFPGHEAFYLTDDRLKAVYELAVKYNVPMLFHSGWENSQFGTARLAGEVANTYPDLKLVCCHCFYPEISDCFSLIKQPNVYFDMSSIADDLSIIEDIKCAAAQLIRMAPDRVLFGSDYSCCDQMQHIEFVRSLGLDSAMQERVFFKNAEELYLSVLL